MQADNSLLTYIPKYFTKKGLSTFLGITFLTSLVFIQRIVPFQWILFNLVEVWLFFTFSSKLSVSWSQLTIETFSKKLVRYSFLSRIVWVVFSYFFYSWMTGKPFEFYTADAIGYHGEGVWLAALLKGNKWDLYTTYIGKNYSDMGYPFYLGLLYYLIGENVFVPRLIKAVLGSLTCLFVYKLTRNNFGEFTGRMAGIMAMLVPNLIYYCGLHTKETEMVFLTVSFVYLADKLIRGRKVKLTDILWVGLLGASLFFFRTVLAVCLISSVALATFLSTWRVSAMNKRMAIVVLLVIGAFLIASTRLSDNINEYVGGSDKNLKSQMTYYANQEYGTSNKLAVYGSKSIFLPVMLMAPFPTLVYIADQPNAMMLGGAYFTRNVYAFFVLIGLFALYKRKKLREHILLLSVVFSYIFVLASSGFALSERFHLPLVPFLLALAAYGISQMNQQNKKYYVPYLFLISLIVIGWNWFKLAGRS